MNGHTQQKYLKLYPMLNHKNLLDIKEINEMWIKGYDNHCYDAYGIYYTYVL